MNIFHWIYKILETNNSTVFSFVFIGILFVIFVQNIVFYLNHRDKTYLMYALYAFIIIVDQVCMNFFIYYYIRYKSSFPFADSIHHSLEWMYNSAYFVFMIHFGGRALFTKKRASILINIIYLMLGILAILFILDIINDKDYVAAGFLYFAVPVLLILSIVVFKHLFAMQSPIRNFILSGAFVFTIFSIVALITTMISDKYIPMGWRIFYVGVFIENIFFSTGLVVKQRLVLDERNLSQKQLILQLRENQVLKEDLAKQLEIKVAQQTKEVIALHEKAEEDRLKKMEIAFEKEMAELKITSLQSQMNPHFIFNSLNSIKLYIIKNDKENAVYYLNKFSKLIRKILVASREKEVSLQDELETVELYVNIENIRFKNNINFIIEVDPTINLTMVKIPPLILQPFIENAIWHGLSTKKGEKRLSIKVLKKSDDYILITIEDNGVGRKRAGELKDNKLHKKKSIGLKLTEERLASFSKNYKNKHILNFIDIKENEERGTRVSIELPIK